MNPSRTTAELAHWRMHSLGLTAGWSTTPEEVVRRLGAVQSQEFGPAKWAVGQRLDGVTNADLDAAVATGRIIRTHLLRPTWHFVVPADLRWMLQLTGPRVHALNAYYYRQQGLDDLVLGTSTEVLVDALQGGRQLTRRELADALERAGITAASLRLGYILINAELNGVICSGAPRGKQHTYALVDERVPPAAELTREQALHELTVRYFTSHGPATIKDFRWWSSLTLTEIRRGLDMAGSRLRSEVVDGLTFWFGEPPPETVPPSPAMYLLQAYDEYIVGYSESRFLLDHSGVARSQWLESGTFIHVLLRDGHVTGRWRQVTTKGSVLIEAVLFEPIDTAELDALKSVADAYGRFFGLPAAVSVT